MVDDTLDKLTRIILDLGFNKVYEDIFLRYFIKDNKTIKITKNTCLVLYFIDDKLMYSGNSDTNIEELINR